MNATDELLNVVERSRAGFEPEEGDFYDDEGFLVCGKCKTRRESMVKLPGSEEEIKVPSLCRCRFEKQEFEKEQKRHNDVVSGLRSISLMDRRLENATFENFVTKESNAKCRRLLESYAKRFDEMCEKSQGLILFGTVGTGKTYGAACVANYLIEREISVVMTSFIKIIDQMRGFDEDSETIIRRINRARLLIIDDLGAERDTTYALEKVYDVIDARYRSKRPMILTTNMSMADMLAEEDVRYSRIYDRIFEMCVPIPYEGPSWRKVEAARRADRMKAFMEKQL